MAENLEVQIKIKAIKEGLNAITEAITDLRKMGAATDDVDAALKRFHTDTARPVPDPTGHAAGGFDRLAGTLKRAAAAAAAFFTAYQAASAIRSTTEQVLDASGAFEMLQMRLAAVYGSQEKGKQAFDWIKTFAQTTPYELEGVTKAFLTLKSYGIDPMDGSLSKLADITTLYGGSQETLERIILATGQAWGKQKLQGEEIRQMVEAGIPVWDMLAKSTGKSVPELQKLSEAGQLGREAIKGLIDEMGRSAGGANAAAMNTWAGLTSNLKDQWRGLLDTIGKSGTLDFAKGKVRDLLSALQTAADNGSLKAFAQRVSDTLTGIGTALDEGLTKVMAFAKDFGAQFNFTEAGNSVRTFTGLVISAFQTLATSGREVAAGIQVVYGTISGAFNLLAAAGTKVVATLMELDARFILWKARLTRNTEEAAYGQQLLSLANDAKRTAEAFQNDLTGSMEMVAKGMDGLATTTTSSTAVITAGLKQQASAATTAAAETAKAADQAAEAEKTKQAAFEATTASLNNLGVDTQRVLTGMGAEVRNALEEIDKLPSKFRQAGISAQDSGRLIVAALQGLIEKAGTVEEIAAIKRRLDDLGRTGTVSVNTLKGAIGQLHDAMARATADPDRLAAAQARAKASADALARAYRDGADATKALAQANADAKAVQDLQAGATVAAQKAQAEYRAETQITAQAITEREKAQAAAILAMQREEAATQRTAKAQAGANEEIRRWGDQSKRWKEDTGTYTSVYAQVAGALESVKRGSSEALMAELRLSKTFEQDWKILAEAARRYESLTQQMQRNNDAASRLSDALSTGRGVAAAMAAATAELGASLGDIDAQHLDGLRSAIQSAKQQMDGLNESARSTLASLQDELYQLQGNIAASEELQYRQKVAELTERLNEARDAGNAQAVEDYRRALALENQIHATKMANIQAEREAEERKARTATAGAGGEAAGNAGTKATATTVFAAAQTQSAAPETATGTPPKDSPRTVRLEFVAPDGKSTSGAFTEAGASQMLELIRQSGMRVVR